MTQPLLEIKNETIWNKKEVSNAWRCTPFSICTNDIEVLRCEINKYTKNSPNMRDRHFVEFLNIDATIVEQPIAELT